MQRSPVCGFAFLTRELERQADAGMLRRLTMGTAAHCFVDPLMI
jgi:hypothetical protein